MLANNTTIIETWSQITGNIHPSIHHPFSIPNYPSLSVPEARWGSLLTSHKFILTFWKKKKIQFAFTLIHYGQFKICSLAHFCEKPDNNEKTHTGRENMERRKMQPACLEGDIAPIVL